MERSHTPLSRPSVVAVMVNFNGGTVLMDSLAALPDAGVPHGAVLLVDNASTDGSGRAAASRFPEIELLETGRECSFAAANNLALEHLARAGAPEAVIFVNNDAILAPGSVGLLRESISREPGAGAAAPLILDTRERIWYAGGHIDWKEAGGRLLGQGKPDSPDLHHRRDVDFATLCVLLVDWAALGQVGLLDEAYRFYDEDLEFCLRLRRAGYRILYEPAATARHLCGHSTAQRGPAFIYRNMARNRLLTMRRHGTPARWAAFLPFFGSMMAWKAIRFIFSGEPGAAAAIGAGLLEGLRDAPSVPRRLPCQEEAPR